MASSTPVEGQQTPYLYSTLKSSLTAASALKSQPSNEPVAGLNSHSATPYNHRGFATPDTDPIQSASEPLKASSTSEIAFAALSSLQTPLLILSSSKTIVFANQALGQMLNLGTDVRASKAHHIGALGVLEAIGGFTLGEIGIHHDASDGECWVDWEDYLDRLLGAYRSRTSTGQSSPTCQIAEPTQNKEWSVASGVPLEVRITTSYASLSRALHKDSLPKDYERRSVALMTAFMWNLNGQQYYTMTFTDVSIPAVSPPLTDSEGYCTRMPSNSSQSHGWMPAMVDSGFSAQHGSSSPDLVLSAYRSPVSPTPPQFPSDQNRNPEPGPPLTDQEKLMRMQNLVLNSLEVPVMGLWKDESVVVVNKAMARLTYVSGTDPSTTDGTAVINRFKLYDEEFTRELSRDEYPVVAVCRSREISPRFKIGLIDEDGRRRNFDFTVDSIFDDETGEFQGVLAALKDVTWYKDYIKAQSNQNERQFQLICEALPQMLWTSTADGDYDYFSPRWTEFTGCHVEQLNPKLELNDHFHPDDQAKTLQKWDHCLATGDPFSAELRCRRHDGVWRWMQGRALPFRDEVGAITKWFGSYTDIHDVFEAQVEAKRVREHLSKVIKHAQVTVWAINTDRKLTLLEGNPMCGDEPSETMKLALGEDVFDFSSVQTDRKIWQAYEDVVERILRGEIPDWTSEHQLKASTDRWYRTRLSPLLAVPANRNQQISSPRIIQGLIGVSIDVTETKERQQELKSREEENMRLLSAEHAAKEASKLKSQFLANMSHEIRTPIAGVMGMSELLLDTDLSAEQKECTENIQRSAAGLLTVINDILDLSKVESGKLDIEEVPFSLTVVVQDVCRMLSYAAERKNLDFRSKIDAAIHRDLVLIGDPGRIRQILTNLLTNSIKFTFEGFVKLEVSVIEDSGDCTKVSFSIEDTGIGIEGEVQKRLFKPFSQADASTARKFGGTGLGLTICKNLVDLMHGEISLKSELGDGTTTSFWIPFRSTTPLQWDDLSLAKIRSIFPAAKSTWSISKSPSAHHSANDDPSSGSSMDAEAHFDVPIRPQEKAKEAMTVDFSHPTFAAPRKESVTDYLLVPPDHRGSVSGEDSQELDRKNVQILVVEDNAINQKIAIKTIQKFGFPVNAVWNGKEALDYLMNPLNARPDVILMDCQMPILDGYKTTHLIRHHSPYSSLPAVRTIPIVAMTASAIQGDKEKCTAAGMDDYLAKPVKGPLLESMLLKWAIEGKNKRRQLPVLRQRHHDEDSICPASGTNIANDLFASTESSGESKKVDLPLSSSPPAPVIDFQAHERLMKIEAAERATALHFDRLMAATESKGTRHTSIPRYNPSARPAGPHTPLTFENIGLLTRELEVNPFDTWPNHDRDFCEGESGESSMCNTPEVGSNLVTPSAVMPTKEEAKPMRLEIRRRLTRNESSVTVVPKLPE